MDKEQLAAIQAEELSAVMGPYVGVAVVLAILWVLIKFTNMPKATDSGKALNLVATFKRLLKMPHYLWAVVAQFFYVGAQIGVWSFTIRYVMQELHLNEDQASSYYMASLVLFAVSRFVFTALMKFISPRVLLMITALVATLCTLVVIYGNGLLSVYALIIISGCMSLMFPTIYGLGVFGLKGDTKIGGSGLIMAILGGAVLPAIQGHISDLYNVNMAFFIPLICFIVIVIYAFKERKPILAPQ